ncbi:MAG: hypothetical protein FJ255_12660 [Phycisphaerae bacterium]|nr:hypothetical protein [Phycisphaerae bacterium]
MSKEVFLRASALLDHGRVGEAARTLDAALVGPVRDPNLVMLRARAFAQQGEGVRGVELARSVVDAHPTHVGFRAALAIVLALAGDSDGSIEAYRQALAGGMDADPQIHAGLAAEQNRAQRFAEAAATARAGLARFAGDPALTLELGHALAGLGRSDEAVRLLLALAPQHPANTPLHEAIAYFCNYTAGADPSLVLHSHRHYGRIVAHYNPPIAEPLVVDRTPGRRLRVGVISSDLGKHVVAVFLAPIFERLDRDRFELFAYSTAAHPDDEPNRALFRRTSTLRDVAGTPPEEVARTIRRDRIDILIETNGLTRSHAQPVLARRAAPVQVTYLGYPNTTGCPNIDVRLVDALTDPPTADGFSSERLARMTGCFLCFTPPAEAPAVSELPCARAADAPFTFGSFNNVRKATDPLLRTWARLLEAVPGSRVLVKSPQFLHRSNGDDLVRRFAEAGGDPARMVLSRPQRVSHDHLAAYSQVDVALDTFPYCGTTTTCEALFMGVPVVSFAGQAERPRHCSRVGLSLLTALGHPEWAANSADEYIATARRLASDRPALASIRAGLRAEMLAGPLCDGAGFAERFGDALARIWAASA